MNKKKGTVILADGTPPSHELPLRILREAERLIVCDGAWRAAFAIGRAPDVVVGDGDSLGDDGRSELALRGISLVTDNEQETNDLCKAFRYALQTGSSGDIAILGATGKREDHAIGNIFHLIDFAEMSAAATHPVAVTMVTDSGVFEPVLPPGRSWTEGCCAGCPLSVFAPFHETEIASEGLAWQLNGIQFDTLWRGTLNKIVSDSFSIQTNRPILIYRPHLRPRDNLA